MGISGPEGVLMLPKGRRPEGSIKTPEGPEIPMSPRAGHIIITFLYRQPGRKWTKNPKLKINQIDILRTRIPRAGKAF